MACNEYGPGRLAEPPAILAAIAATCSDRSRWPAGMSLVTSGPTHEPIDPVRYIANRSSGRQGHAIAAALAALGARVTLVSGPVAIARSARRRRAPGRDRGGDAGGLPGRAAGRRRGLRRRRRRLAGGRRSRRQDEEGAGRAAAAAGAGAQPRHPGDARRPRARRPRLVVGFAAETDDLLEHAGGKRAAQGLRLDRRQRRRPATGIMGGTENEVHLVTAAGDRALADAGRRTRSPAGWPRASPGRWHDRVSIAVRAAAACRGTAAAGLCDRRRGRDGSAGRGGRRRSPSPRAAAR